jgi:two-component system, response regulator PdtaR
MSFNKYKMRHFARWMKRGSVKILIVEDDALIALDLERQLVQLGNTVCGTASEEEGALSKAADHKPDLVLMDLTLAKGGSGQNVAAHLLREHGIRCIFVSANLSDDVRASLAPLQPFGFINKPISKGALKAALQSAEVAVASGPATRNG